MVKNRGLLVVWRRRTCRRLPEGRAHAASESGANARPRSLISLVLLAPSPPRPPFAPRRRIATQERPATLVLDASRAADGIMEVRERIPAVGRTALRSSIRSGFRASTARPDRSTISPRCESPPMERALDWRRDSIDLYAFHVNVPAGRAGRSTSPSTC